MPEDYSTLLRDYWKDLSAEAHLVERLYLEQKSPESARVFVRSCFSILEGFCAIIMNGTFFQFLPKIEKEVARAGITMEMQEAVFRLTALGYRQFEIDDNGEVKLKAMRLNFTRQLLFSIKTLARAFGKSVDPKKVGGWEALQRAIKVRDRITHPKSPQQLLVTDEEVQDTMAALAWYNASVAEITKTKPPPSEGGGS